MTLRKSLLSKMFLAFALALMTGTFVYAQTSTFTYQGRFTEGGSAANGTYDIQFKLFDGANNQIGSTITNSAVQVSSGVFAVQLDFGAAAFPGADRFLEIAVRSAGSADAYTVLSPRQQLTATPYAIRSATADTATNATKLNGTDASQFVQTNDSRLSDLRPPTPGSDSYIQNSNNQQVATFNISGGGRAGELSANLVNANTQYNLGGVRAISLGTQSIYVGAGSGASITTGTSNAFFGFESGRSNTGGVLNSFFGMRAGQLNQGGDANAFFGAQSGFKNSTGSQNTFLGEDAGSGNTSGDNNTYVGQASGELNSLGSFNTAVGYQAGRNPGDQLTLIGAFANVGNQSLTNAAAIGYGARVSQSNSLVLGSVFNGTGSPPSVNVGIGTTAPAYRLSVRTDTSSYGVVHTDGTVAVGTYIGGSTGGGWFGTKSNHSLSFFVNDGSPSMTIETGGTVKITTLGAAGSTQLCRNASNQISTCSSSLRYKTNIQPFAGGLSVLNRLRPITFDWKQGGMHDLGFGAEDIAAIEPLLVTRNEKGEVEGVKYDRISAVLVNAVQEQQQQISRQQEQIKLQQNEIEILKRLVCRRNRRASVCK